MKAPPTGEHARGARDAGLVLEEFGDFASPYCTQAFPIVRRLLTGKEAFIRLVYRHFPASASPLHAELAAEAAEAAGAQGKFWEFHDLLFSRTSELNGRLLVGFAQRLGLDLSRFDSDLEAHVHRARVQQDLKAGRARGVVGAPGFYLNGKIIDTTYGLHHLCDAIQAALADCRSLPRTISRSGACTARRVLTEPVRTMDIQGNAAILLVEDDEFVRVVTLGMLRALGYLNITVAANGEEAVKACAGARFDLILMDCEMPVLDGLDATRRIRAAGVRTPVVAYTASVTTANRSRCAEAGMDDFLAKPAQPGQLAMKLHLWLRSSRR